MTTLLPDNCLPAVCSSHSPCRLALYNPSLQYIWNNLQFTIVFRMFNNRWPQLPRQPSSVSHQPIRTSCFSTFQVSKLLLTLLQLKRHIQKHCHILTSSALGYWTCVCCQMQTSYLSSGYASSLLGQCKTSPISSQLDVAYSSPQNADLPLDNRPASKLNGQLCSEHNNWVYHPSISLVFWLH